MTDTKKNGARYDTGPTVAVVVGDLKGAWNNGVFVGDDELVDWAKRMSESKVTARVFSIETTCTADTPLGALAAMSSYLPGRTIIIDAPDELIDAIRAARGELDTDDELEDDSDTEGND